MNFNVVSKNNMGYASALLLVVLLSQSKVFNFLIETTLGRTILISFILFIAYTNKILGVVVVLFIVIIFNNSDIGYLESFTDASNNTNVISTSGDVSAQTKHGSEELAQKTKDKKDVTHETSTKPTTTNTPNITDTTTTTTSSSATAVEGFDIVGKERHIQKGNQSNQIPVNDFMRVSPDVSPYEGSPFSESFSSY